MTANVEQAKATLADTRMELEEVSKKLVSTTDELSDLLGQQEVVNAEKRAAVNEASRWRNWFEKKETELIAARLRIKELETNASRVVLPVPVIEHRASSPTETPHIPRGTGSGIDELLRGDTTSSSTLPTYRPSAPPSSNAQMMEAGMPERGDNISSSSLPAYRQPVAITSTSHPDVSEGFEVESATIGPEHDSGHSYRTKYDHW